VADKRVSVCGVQNSLHRRFHNPSEVQLCTLMNIKTGGCTEDCKYCAQSTRYQQGTGLEAKKTESVEKVLAAAREAKDNGATRFCMYVIFELPTAFSVSLWRHSFHIFETTPRE
jgi:biotin synthase-like enzyme